MIQHTHDDAIQENVRAIEGLSIIATEMKSIALALSETIAQLAAGGDLDPMLLVDAVSRLESAAANTAELDRKCRDEVKQQQNVAAAAASCLTSTALWSDEGELINMLLQMGCFDSGHNL